MINTVRSLIDEHNDLAEKCFIDLSESDVNTNPKRSKNQCSINGCTGNGHVNGKYKRHMEYALI